MNRTLITGSEGFIGSHLVEELVRQGRSVRAFVLYNSFDSWGWLDTLSKDLRDNLEVVLGDVRDAACVKNAMKDCDSVFHLAALIAIPYSYRAPESYVATNMTGTLNVVQAACDLDMSKVVITSTSEVYGTAQTVPITEEHPLVGQSPYAATKIGADQMALSFFRSFDTPVAIARPFNTYGPRQSARAVIPTTILQIVEGKQSLRLGATAPTRDFNYIHDIVRGLIAVHDSPGSIGEVINIGSGTDISIGDTVAMIADIMGVDVDIESDPQRMRPENSEVMRLCADNAKARDLLGWKPEYAGPEGLRKGLIKTAEWFSDEENRRLYRDGRYIV